MSSSRTSTPSNKDAQSYVSRILLPANPLRQMSTNSPYKSSPLRTSSPAPTSSSPWTLSWLTAASPRDRIGTPPSLFNFKSPMRNPIRSPANRSLRVGGPSTPSRLGYLPRVTDLPLEPTSMMERALRILESKKRPLNALSDETENLPLTPDGLATAKRRCASVSTSTVQQNNSHQTALPDVANLGVNGTPEYFKCTSLVDIKRTSRRSSDNHSDLASEPGRPDVVVSTQRNRPVGKPLTSSVLPNRVSCLPSAELEALAFGSRKRPRAESPHTSSTSSAAAELLDSILGTTVASPAAPAAKRVTREIPTQTENASPSVAVSAVTTTAAAATTASTSFSPPTTVQPLRHVSSVSKFIAGLEARARASALARSRSRQMRSFAGQIETLGSPASYSLEARHDRIRKLFASLAEVPSTVTAATTASSLATVSSSSSTVAVTTASLCVTTASAPSVPVFIFGKEQSQKTIESLSSSPATIATASTAEGPVSIFPTAATTTAPAVPFGQKADAIKPELPVVAGLPTASSVVQSEGTTSTAGSAVFSFGNSGMAAAQTTNSTTPLFTVCAGGSLPSSTSTTCSTAATTSTASISSPFVSATGVSLAAPLSSSASVPSFNFGGKSSSSSASTTSSPTFNFGRVEAVATSGSATTTPLTSVFGSAAKTPVTSISAAVSTTFQLASTMTNTSGISASPAPTMTLFMQPKPSTTGLTTTVVPSSVLVASTTSSLFAPSSLPAVVSNSTTNAFSFGLKGTTTSASAVSVPPVSTTGTSQLTTSTLFNFGAKPTAPSTTAPAVPGFSFVTAPSFASEAPVFGSNTSSSSALASNAVPITTTTTASSLFGAINATGAATKPAFSFGALTSASSGTSLSTSQSASSKPSPGFPFTLPSTTAASRATSIFASTAPASSAATSTPTLFAPFAITQNGVSMAATSTTSSVPSTTSSSTFLFGVAPSTSAATNSSSAFGAAGSTVPNFAFSATSTTAPTFKSPAFGSPVGSTTAAATTTSVASTGGFAFTAAVAGPLSVASSLFGNPAVSSFSVGSPSLFGQSPDTSSATLFAPSKASPATSTTSAANRGLSFASVSSASTTSVFGDKFGATTGPVVSSNGFSFGASTATNSTATVAQPALAGGFAFNFKAATANTTSAAPAAVSIFTSPKSSPANLFAAGASTQPSAMAATAPGPFGLMATTTAGPSFTFGSTATSAATTASNMVFGSAGGFGSSVDALKRTASSAFDAAPSTTTTIGPFGSALTFGASATGSPAQPSAAKSVAFGAPVFGVTSAGQPFNFTGGASSTTTPSNGFNFMLGSTTSAQNAFGSPSVGNFVFGQATPPTFGAQPGVGGSPPNPFSANPSPVGTTSLHRRRQLRLKGRR